MSQYKDIPQPTDQRNVSQNDILTNYRYLCTPLGGPAPGIPNGILPVDHFATADNVANPTDGFHKQTSFINRAIPASLTNAINGQNSDAIQYAFSDGAGQSQPYWLNGAINSPMMPIRAFVLFAGPSAVIAGQSYNVNNPGGVTRAAAGDYTVNFSVAMPTVNYLVFALAQSTSGAQIYGISYTNKLLNSIQLKVFRVNSGGGGTTADDPDQISMCVMGIF